jgi:hypothetical protein
MMMIGVAWMYMVWHSGRWRQYWRATASAAAMANRMKHDAMKRMIELSDLSAT